MTTQPLRPPGQVLTAVAYLVVLLLAFESAVWGAFLVPLRIDDHAVPVGIAIALVANIVLGIAGGRVLGSRLGQVAPGVVWLLVALVLSSARPEGDVIVQGGLRGLAFLLVGTLAATGVLGVPLRAGATPGVPTGR